MNEPDLASASPTPTPVSRPSRWAWKVCVAITGIAMIIIGIPLIPMPIVPGGVVIAAGFALLATEFIWAKQLLTRVRIWFKQQSRRWKNRKKPEAK